MNLALETKEARLMSPQPVKIPTSLIARLRVERGLTTRQLGKLVGTSQQTITKIEQGKRENSPFLSAIAEVLGITPEMIAQEDPQAPVVAEAMTAAAAGSKLSRLPLEIEGRATLPLYVTLGRVIGTTYRRFKCSTKKVLRPPMLRGDNAAYAMLMPDDSMRPEYHAGDTLLIQPSEPVVPGNSYVFVDKNDNFKVKFLLAIKKDHYLVRSHRDDNSSNAEDDRLAVALWRPEAIVSRNKNLET